MDRKNYFRYVARDLRNYARYSSKHYAWVIPTGICPIIIQLHMPHRPPELSTLGDILEEGVRRGFWEMDLDLAYEKDIVVLS